MTTPTLAEVRKALKELTVMVDYPIPAELGEYLTPDELERFTAFVQDRNMVALARKTRARRAERRILIKALNAEESADYLFG